MRILLLAPIPPFPPTSGLQKRMHGILRALAATHTVDLLCFYRQHEDPRPAALVALCTNIFPVPRETCYAYHRRNTRAETVREAFTDASPPNTINLRSAAMQAQVEAIDWDSYDAIWVERLGMGQYVPVHTRAKVLVDFDDVESIVLGRTIAAAALRLPTVFRIIEMVKQRLHERHAVRRYDAVLVASVHDRRRLGRDNVQVLPNTVSIPSATTDDTNDNDLIFFGLLSYDPNTDGILYFLREIWPHIRMQRPQARLWIVGAKPPAAVNAYHDNVSVIVTGFVADLHALLARCAVAIAPLRIGGGTRIKILDAMAAGKAVVATSIGYEGLDVTPGTHLLAADAPRAFAAACVQLMADRSQRQQLGLAARALVAREYDSASLPAIVADILATTFAAPKAPPCAESAQCDNHPDLQRRR